MSKLIAMMGAKDRVGTSTLSFQLALGLKRRKKRVLLLDWDVSYLGDLRFVSEEEGEWPSFSDLEKLSYPFQEKELLPLLKGPEGLNTLQLAKSRLKLSPQNTDKNFLLLKGLEPFFYWIIADVGSRWNSYINPLLSRTDLLLLVANTEVTLVEELKRKCEELTLRYFPSKRLGWLANQWDPNSFLTVSAVTEYLKIPFFGENVEELIEGLKKIPSRNGEPLTFQQPHHHHSNFKVMLLKSIQDQMETKGIKKDQEENIRPKVTNIIQQILEERKEEIPPDVDYNALTGELLDDILGLGVLESLLANPNYTEILVNGTSPIYVEEAGKLKKTSVQFINKDSLSKVIERILLPIGRRVDEASPMVDARLKDGSRVNIVIPPLSLDGPMISIRRFSKEALKPEDLIRFKTANDPILKFLEQGVKRKLNILVSGGTGSGKTTLLNILSSFIPKNERIVTIEDAAELKLNQPHVVRLETRPPNVEGQGEVSIRELVRNSLRMRPDRIVVGECRGKEALDMLSAMNTGHEGSLTTLHANSPREALSRLETLVMFAGHELPSKAIREQIASSIDLIIQISRLSDGSRKITSIVKLAGLEGETFTLQDLFIYENEEFKELLAPW